MQGIISDLFPGLQLPKSDYDLMNAAIRDACASLNLQPTDYFMLKVRSLDN
jgi:dynein heavy chain